MPNGYVLLIWLLFRLSGEKNFLQSLHWNCWISLNFLFLLPLFIAFLELQWGQALCSELFWLIQQLTKAGIYKSNGFWKNFCWKRDQFWNLACNGFWNWESNWYWKKLRVKIGVFGIFMGFLAVRGYWDAIIRETKPTKIYIWTWIKFFSFTILFLLFLYSIPDFPSNKSACCIAY